METSRLHWREFQTEDYNRLVELFADHEVAKWVDDGKPLSAEKAKKWIEVSHKSKVLNGTSAGAIVEKSSQRVIGWGGIVHPQDSEPEIIYGFEKAAWGKGYGTELAQALIADGFTNHGIKSIIATVDPENLGSTKILKSLNFAFVERGFDEHDLPTDTYRLSNI